MKRLVSLSLIFIIISSCSNNKENDFSSLICNVEKPTEDLDWIESEIDILTDEGDQYNYIKQAEYNNQTVFIFANCNPFVNSVFFVKTCDGQNIGIIGTREQDIPWSILNNGEIIWKTDDSECNL